MSSVSKLAELEEALACVMDEVEASCEEALLTAALQIGTEAVSLAPAKTGALRESARLTADGVPFAVGQKDGKMKMLDGARPRGARQVTLSFDAPYAAQVHEHTEISHAVGEAKFLERAALSGRERLIREMKRAINAEREDD